MVLTLSILLSKLLTGRIEDLLSAIRGVREGSYNHRADVSGNDEIAQIADEFNNLTGPAPGDGGRPPPLCVRRVPTS